ncbi:MAG: Tol-Pal system beta propeller repeat protein TolB, partial [Candidatus Aminicenantes bacterium]|nr:Tol-Pal system beta propeller repeat protein TolB [Candidatus Aminicenantes bacterium]
MKTKRIMFCGTFLFLTALILYPQQEVVMSLKDGMPAIPLAIPEFIIHSSKPEAKSIAQQLHQIISEDFKYSRVFQLLPKSYYNWIRPLNPKKIFFK